MGAAAEQTALVAEAFSRNATYFDEVDEKNPIVAWMRKRVRSHFLSTLKPASRILEINAGTGIDAEYFAGLGHTVLATDNAPGMLEKMRQKIAVSDHPGRLTARQCSFNDLRLLNEGTFDAIYSNFGGLNCTADLGEVISRFASLLNPGGTATLVIMPRVCPWELLQIVRGKAGLAFRRLKKNGAPSLLGGVYFYTYYYTPREVIKYFGSDFEMLKLESLGCLVPPPYMENFPARLPRLFRSLRKWEEKIAHYRTFRNWGDYFILTMQYLPKER
ncbi:MAG: methyltransferase domain-containing protein [Bacteroidota bacterium]|nr:methyltransferase domain-containing protein [Bacteroidota bacterium]